MRVHPKKISTGRIEMKKIRLLWPVTLLGAALLLIAPASAQTIVEEWSTIKPPPAPELKAVTPDPKTTALLLLDFVKQNCNVEKRPRCVASISKVEKLRTEARANGMTVISTTVPPVPITDTVPTLAPNPSEPVVVAWVDKFMLGDKDTGLEEMLKDKGIATLIAVGTAAHGAVLYTSLAAALRGFDVVVPVDGMSGEGELAQYSEQAVAFILTHAPAASPKITLTRIDMIRFAN
jgi:nicotinamidase-related amidase